MSDLKATNLRSNQNAITDLLNLIKSGGQQLEGTFQSILREDAQPVEPLHYITKDKPFPILSSEKTTRLGLVNDFLVKSTRQSSRNPQEFPYPTAQMYANIRGPYLTATLSNLAAAAVNTARKKTPDAVYRQGTNGIGTYATGLEGAFLAEYENICLIFSREDWSRIFTMTCQRAMNELSTTMRELTAHIKANLTTDCFLAYEIIEIISGLSSRVDGRTGEMKSTFAQALRPIRETGKSSLAELLDDTRRRVNSLQALPIDGASIPITTETMTRLLTMVDFLRPVSSILISLGDGNWKTTAAANSTNSADAIPTLKSFDVGADGRQLFAHYCTDTIDVLLSSLDAKARTVLQTKFGKSVVGVFLANSTAVVDRSIRTSDLQPLLANRMAQIDVWRKKAVSLYLDSWKDTSACLLDVQYTNRANRPTSGSAANIDSAAILKGMSTSEKTAIKAKFKEFNDSFDDLVQKHKNFSMEREVREMLARAVQQMIEPLYGRFWDRYHEIDKGKGRVKYDKVGISGVFLSLG